MIEETVDSVRKRSAVLRELLLNRRSVRQFKDESLDQEHVQHILEAAIYAPSGSNSQNQRFLLIEDKQELEAIGRLRFVWPYPTAAKMREKKPAGLIGGAAAAVLVFADAALTDARNNGEYYIWESLEIQNCAASIENMLNMAAALGVGSCWLSASENMSHTRLLSGRSWAHTLARYEIPRSFKIQAVVILGYPRSGLDDNGFPRGEKEHGATFWQSTQRRSIDHYKIKRREISDSASIRIGFTDKVKLKILSWIISALLTLARKLEDAVYHIEVDRVLAKIYQGKS